MQTTLRIDNSLYREAKARAAREGITLTRFLEDAIRTRLEGRSAGGGLHVQEGAPVYASAGRDALTKVLGKGHIVLPDEIRSRDGIRAGDAFVVKRVQPGEYRLVRKAPSNEGLIDWLRRCPAKGYFVPVESESTDTL